MGDEQEGYGVASWLRSAPYLVWRANNAVHRRLQDALGELDVSISQWGIMEHIDEFGALSASDISRGIHLTPQSINTAVGVLEKQGLIVRRPHPGHGRVVLWELTTRGCDVVAEGRTRVAVVREEVDEILGSDGAVRSALARLVESLDGPQTPFEPRWDETGSLSLSPRSRR
jgi:DNA-binding MarR family transcriptional regulator